MHYATQIESLESAISLGRMDQFLYPAYQADVEAGRLSRDRALELLACFYLKLSQSIPLFDSVVTLAFSGLTNFANTVIGGMDAEGEDVTNELSYLMLEAMKRVRSPQPNFGVRLHRRLPRAFRDAVMQAAADGIGNLQLFNDEAIIAALTNRGIPLEDARDYGIIGCVEPAVPNKSFTSSDAALFNLPLCLELALNNGRGRLFCRAAGACPPATREASQPSRMSSRPTGRRWSTWWARWSRGWRGWRSAHAERRPVPLASSLTDDCLARGLDLTAGGARYNFTGVQGVGVATVGDSLAAIDRLVFREKRITMDELLAALDADFAGQEPLRQMLLNKAPKYGNDDDDADRFARLAAEIYCRAVEKHPNFRGGWYSPGLYSVTTHIVFGLMVGATPDGRHARQPLSQGISPANGRDRCGPTAALKSAAKLDHTLVSNGLALNQMLSLGAAAREHAADVLGGLVEGLLRAWAASTCSGTWWTGRRSSPPSRTRRRIAGSSSAYRATAPCSPTSTASSRTSSSPAPSTPSEVHIRAAARDGHRDERGSPSRPGQRSGPQSVPPALRPESTSSVSLSPRSGAPRQGRR